MNLINWQFPEKFPVLQKDEVHVWYADLQKVALDQWVLEQWLSAEEIEYIGKISVQPWRDYYTAAHLVLRNLLGAYLQKPADAIQLVKGEHGKPRLAGSGNLRFNMSHAQSVALYAFALDREVGIDVENDVREVEVLEIAKRFFAKAEYEYLVSLPIELQRKAFFQIWTCKEAVVKADGRGLSYPLSDFVVNVAGEESLVQGVSCVSEASCPYQVVLFRAIADFSAALAVSGASMERHFWRWSALDFKRKAG